MPPRMGSVCIMHHICWTSYGLTRSASCIMPPAPAKGERIRTPGSLVLYFRESRPYIFQQRKRTCKPQTLWPQGSSHPWVGGKGHQWDNHTMPCPSNFTVWISGQHPWNEQWWNTWEEWQGQHRHLCKSQPVHSDDRDLNYFGILITFSFGLKNHVPTGF